MFLIATSLSISIHSCSIGLDLPDNYLKKDLPYVFMLSHS